MKAIELEKMFNVDAEEIERWDKQASRGILPGKPSGKVEFGPGRPQMFGEEMCQIGFREPESKANLIKQRASNLGLKRSDYLRHLIDADLKNVGML